MQPRESTSIDFTKLPGPCPLCEGEGQVIRGAGIDSPLLRPEIVECPRCDGTGEVVR